MGYYLTPAGKYYTGDRAHVLDAEVPPRPTKDYTWNGSTWVAPDPAAQLDQQATREIDARDRLQFEITFDMENRVRALEGKQPVTRATYRDALITRWKQLNGG